MIAGCRVLPGDCLAILPTLEAEGFHAVVTDPPYELGFMSKRWDSTGVAFSKDTWAAVARVMKPGAYLAAFGGTRTFHRMAVAIEDAGFEIRDTLMWLYGVGFPKSHDVSKAVDRTLGAERGKVAPRSVISHQRNIGNRRPYMDDPNHVTDSDEPAPPEAARWSGWGTALKPAHEDIILAQKPYNLPSLCGIVAHKLLGAICQLPSLVKDAEPNSLLSLSVSNEAFGSAQWNAVLGCNSPADLLDLTATWQSGSTVPLSLSIGLSWLNTLAAICSLASTFTTETASSLITDLKILNCYPLQITADTIIQDAMLQHGIGSNASVAGLIFSAANARLNLTLGLSAAGLATSSGDRRGLHPNFCPIILARKPLIGTVAENVLRHGTGGLNIDACRIGTTTRTNASAPRAERNGFVKGFVGGTESVTHDHGRWPANLCHDGSDEAVWLFPSEAGGGSSNPTIRRTALGRMNDDAWQPKETVAINYPDSGSAARFFKSCPYEEGDFSRFHYSSKASAKDRAGSKHPTVKPLALMRWLCTLITPPGGRILDPFAGSGTTLQAARECGFEAVGIEQEDEYVADIARRLASATSSAPRRTPKRKPATADLFAAIAAE